MGLVHLDIFSTLDGIAQAPGQPDEDTDGGFPFGGWQAPLGDGVQGREILAGMQGMDALLLGRRTYDIFAGYWPQHDGRDVIADLFNRIPKYVASRTPRRLDWAHSVQLDGDVTTAVRAVRDRHEHVHVIGSLDFAQTLLAAQLVDHVDQHKNAQKHPENPRHHGQKAPHDIQIQRHARAPFRRGRCDHHKSPVPSSSPKTGAA